MPSAHAFERRPLAPLPCRFLIDARYYHDLALGRGASLSVFNGGAGLDLNLHHESGKSRLAWG